uniref:DDE Tnp4 domain-containing protein n=1 Tax=Sipha flava TaxID=143950 RepID=A0A2S2R443_9HEMI
MAVVDANYEILMADEGKNGRISDGGVIKNTSFYNSLIKGELNIPPPERLPGSNKTAPYVFISDEAFQLTNNFMKPYALSVLNNERRIYNYRLSKARRVVENIFGILVSRFAVLGKPINLRPTKTFQWLCQQSTCNFSNFTRNRIGWACIWYEKQQQFSFFYNSESTSRYFL